MFYSQGLGIVVERDEYSVTIVTSPEQGPFRLGQEVMYSCVVEPEPPEPVTYQWRSVEHIYGGASYSQQSFSRSYSIYTLRYCWYSCEVAMNETKLGFASTMVEIHGELQKSKYSFSACVTLAYTHLGFLYPTGSVMKSFSHGGSLQMNVSISTDYSAQYISSLAWYHNGTRIVTGHRFTITDNGTALHIRDMEESDAGQYEAKISSIDTELHSGLPNDAQCDSWVLPLLESLAVHAPVTFIVQESCPQTRSTPMLTMSMVATMYAVNNQTVQLYSISEVNNITTRLQTQSNWYRNGVWISNGPRYNIMIDNEGVHSLVITYNATEEALGVYAGILSTDPFFSGLCGGYTDYLQRVHGLLNFRYFLIPIYVSLWNIVLYSKL